MTCLICHFVEVDAGHPADQLLVRGVTLGTLLATAGKYRQTVPEPCSEHKALLRLAEDSVESVILAICGPASPPDAVSPPEATCSICIFADPGLSHDDRVLSAVSLVAFGILIANYAARERRLDGMGLCPAHRRALAKVLRHDQQTGRR